MKRKRNRTNTEKTVGRRINSADVMILFLFVACIAAMVMRFGLVERIEHRANAQNVNVSFLIEGVSGTSAQYLHIGDEVYLADNDMKAGRISGVSATEPSVVYVYADDGSILQKQAVDIYRTQYDPADKNTIHQRVNAYNRYTSVGNRDRVKNADLL